MINSRIAHRFMPGCYYGKVEKRRHITLGVNEDQAFAIFDALLCDDWLLLAALEPDDEPRHRFSIDVASSLKVIKESNS